MPYKVVMRGGKHLVVVHPGTKKERILASHDTHEKAVNQVQAIYANEMKKGKKDNPGHYKKKMKKPEYDAGDD